MIIIQQIRLTWTKKSRGAPGAALRNAVPKSLLIRLDQCDFLFEEHDCDEKDGFTQKQGERQVMDHLPPAVHNLVLERQNDELVFHFGSYNGFRSSNRVDLLMQYPKTRILLRLKAGMYGRIVINARHTEESYHWYSQDTYNIVEVDYPTTDWFISREPDQICDLRIHLF